MSYLSIPIGELRARYDVIVVGSGYGGGVAALRMTETVDKSQPGRSVCVLERGRERRAGEFPATLTSALRQTQFASPRWRLGRRDGLFDLRYDRDMAVLVGCGLGGTSLINANVMIQADRAVFDNDRWPERLRNRDRIESFYGTARRMLSATECAENVYVYKRSNLFAAGDAIRTLRPELAVSFSDGLNRQGVHHRHCTMCGDCVTGCNHGAKNTTDRNYLAEARNRGAEIFCGVAVRSVEPFDGEWLVHAALVDRAWARFRSPEIVLRAGMVFLAAGTLGSTEILLRSRQRHRLSLSPKLGHQFSGNGDVIAFSYNGRETVQGFGYGAMVPDDSSVGPTITGMLDERNVPGEPAMTIQDASIPGPLAPIIRVAAPLIARRTRIANFARDFSLHQIRAELTSMFRGVQHGAVARTQTFLVMSRDKADGALKLSRRGDVRIDWPGAGTDPLFRQIHARLAQLTKKMGGRFVANPMWIGPRKRLLSVHPLGGCPMGDDASNGVVNDLGQVFEVVPPETRPEAVTRDADGRPVYQGLYVCDGAIVPTSLGTNPALTITALAERIALNVPLNVRPKARPSVPAAPAPAASDFSIPGIQYAERLTGSVTLGDAKQTGLELLLHISADSIEKLLTDPRHEARIIGRARTPDLPKHGLSGEWTVTNGFLNVLVEDPRHPCTRLMVYRLELVPPKGEPMFLRGHKIINLETCRQSTWRAISSFRFALHGCRRLHESGPPNLDVAACAGKKEQLAALERQTKAFSDACDWVERNTHARVCTVCKIVWNASSIGDGRVRNLLPDALRLARSLEITKERRLLRRVRLLARFAWSFVDAVIEARVWALQRTKRPDPFTRPILEEPEDRRPPIEDGRLEVAGLPRYRLTTYGSSKGLPLILGPGFGMSSEAFLSGDPSVFSYLQGLGYEVWLLDYRGSDKLDISLTQFTLDELVDDFAEAIITLREATGHPVRVIGHCVASLVMTMLLLKKGDLGGSIHSVLLSQSFGFIDHPLINRIKAAIRLPQVLRFTGFIPMLTVDDDLRSDWRSRVLDRVLRFYPTAERCDSAVCRRILFMYGEVNRHAKLNAHTHDLMYDFFDRANLTSFVHLSKMILAGHIVDRNGRNTYLTHENGAGIRVPVTLFQGMKNRLFRPAGGHRMLRWLRQHGADGGALAERLFHLVEVPDYGHLDNFVGTHAACEVFPILKRELIRMEQLVQPRGKLIGASMECGRSTASPGS
jgi:cholesterol oxidase